VAASVASARRYAEAAFAIADEGNALDRWSGDLLTIANFVDEPEVAGIVSSGRVPRDEKLRLLDAGLKAYLSPLAMNLVRLLEQRGKIALARDIQVAFQAMLDDRRGVAHAVVTTAVPLADDERAAVAAKLSAMTGKQVDVTAVVDASIIGGIVARIGDQLVDGSTRSRLAALKRSLEGATR
jgi:F-type H+-transporting ATPase subunit delta